jgi:WD40 repeat protein
MEAAKAHCDSGRIMIGEACIIHDLRQHLTKVQDVSFSSNAQFLCTVGGQDDNSIVIWNVETGEALCGAHAASDSVLCCTWLNGRNDRVITAGHYHVRVWQIDFRLPKLHPMDAKFGNVRRVFLSIAITSDDHFAFCGTATGDVIKVKIDRNDIGSFNDPDTITPMMVGCSKDRVAKGVQSIVCVGDNVLIGAGDGTLVYITPLLKTVPKLRTGLMGGISSVAVHPSGSKFMVGTDQCNLYSVSADLSQAEMKTSCHYGAINDVTYPESCPDLVVTASMGDVRVWNVRMSQELLRIQVPNLECFTAVVSPTGSTLLSGWSDGKVRAFYPESGKMKFVIPDAHSENVLALAVIDNDASSPWRIVSGGSDGRVRIWKISSSHQALVTSMKEHRGPVNALKVSADRSQCISASSDGCCIIWDLERYVRLNALFESNVFRSIQIHPDESQMLSCGSNHKITYWDSADCQAIRVIDGGDGCMTSLDIDSTGEFFVSGSADKLIKIWHYDDGIPIAFGRGHSGQISKLKISPDQKSIVSVGSTGEIMFWEMPTAQALRRKLDELMAEK